MKLKNIRKKISMIGGLTFGLFLLGMSYSGPGLLPPTSPPTADPTKDVSPLSFDAKPANLRLSSISTTSEPSDNSVTNHQSGSATRAISRVQEKTFVIDDKEYPLRTYAPLATPNDPYANQWWTTQSKLSAAWDMPRGNSDTLIAIIDTGFGLMHEDLVHAWAENAGEIGAATTEGASLYNCSDRGLALDASCNLVDDDVDGILDNETGIVDYENPSELTCTASGIPLTKQCNRIDDDANGYIDDARGWDFVNHDKSVQAGQLNPSGSGTVHGTMVAGVAAAKGNNAKGLAGADWDTRVLPLQAIDDNSYGDTRSVGRAIRYAATMGADVISLSLGSSLPDPYVQESVQVAIASGAIVVAASGNDGCDCMLYPARYPEVLSVGAIGENGSRTSFSSYGSLLDVVAPGENITTATWSAANGTSAYRAGVSGTSFAAPLVSGTLSRLLSYQPDMTPLQLRAALTENLNRLTLGTTRRSNTLGFGSLDASKAQSRVTTPLTPTILYALNSVSSGTQLNPTAPAESLTRQLPYDCQQNTGTTALYELKKGSAHVFSMSESEVFRAKQNGYTDSHFVYTCLALPHDTPSNVRLLNIFSEFRNILKRK